MSLLREKQEGGCLLHMTNDLRIKISPPLSVILEDIIVISLRIIQDH